MISAASAAANMPARSGAMRARRAAPTPYRRPRMMRASATDVRELMSPASV